MRSILLTFTVLMAFNPFFAQAGNQADARIPASDLHRVPLIAGPLRITITKFKDHGLFSFDRYLKIDMEIENTSTDFVTFSPQSISFVESDGNQENILGIRIFHQGHKYESSIMPAPDRRIAPAARIKVSYILTDRVDPPVRFYYDDKLLATIVD
ncbi:MAG TPA: hypothetical protein VNO14_12665 [Blastocatellia bacterium]|nr:hypothetical protein [Blastocatellia bacterium]